MFGLYELKNDSFLPDELNNIEEGLDNLGTFCALNNIKCYIEIVPRKLDFTKDKVFKNFSESEPDRALQLITHYKNDNITFIYPKAELLQANKKDYVYFKTDHHWTEWGAYNGYLALISQIQKDFKNIIPVSENDYNIYYNSKVRAEVSRQFWSGSICQLLRLGTKYCQLDVKYKYYEPKNKLNIQWDKKTHNKIFQYPQALNKQTVTIIGNSFTENFVPFLACTFPHVTKYRANNKQEDNLNLSRWQADIVKNRTDILLIVINYGYISRLRDLKD